MKNNSLSILITGDLVINLLTKMAQSDFLINMDNGTPINYQVNQLIT